MVRSSFNFIENMFRIPVWNCRREIRTAPFQVLVQPAAGSKRGPPRYNRIFPCYNTQGSFPSFITGTYTLSSPVIQYSTSSRHPLHHEACRLLQRVFSCPIFKCNTERFFINIFCALYDLPKKILLIKNNRLTVNIKNDF